MSVLAKHTVGKGGPDKVFRISGMAKARAAEVGKENIVNATTGAFLDGDGRLMTMKTVEAVVKEIPFNESCEYATIEGSPEFIEAAIDAAFREYRPDAFIRGVATPGGTGGIHHAIFNYLDDGDAVLVMNRYWAAYKNICRETNRRLETFPMFTEDWKFNVQGCVDKLYEIAEQQTNVMLIMNTPANNPTGYNVKADEWEVIMKVLSNLLPLRTMAMTNAALSGDLDTAAALQQQLQPLIELLFCEPNPIPVKAAMRYLGYDCGSPRLPLTELSKENKERLKKALD